MRQSPTDSHERLRGLGCETTTDFAALQRADPELRNLNHAVEQSPAAIVITDRQGRIEYVNPKFTQITGYTREEALGKNPRILKTGHTSVEEYHRLWETITSGKEWRGEFLNRRRDGGLFWESASISPVIDDDGVIRHFVAVKEDITDSKRVRDKLMLDERRLESLFRISQHQADSAPELLDFALEEAISLTDSKIGYIYHYSEERREFTLNTWSREVMKECSIRDAQTVYQLDQTGVWGEAVRQRKPILLNDFHAPHPLKKGYPEGHAPLHRYLTIPVFSRDKIVGVVGVANKETDYDQSDVRQLMLLMDAVWRITERQQVEDELRARTERLGLLNVTLEQEQGRLLELTGELTQANEELKRLSEAKSDFVAAVSHDLRTPLTTITEAISLTLDGAFGPVSGEQNKFLGFAREDAAHLNDLISNLLDVAKIERGKITVNPTPVNVTESLQRVRSSYVSLAQEKSLKLTVEVPAGPLGVLCDPEHYHRTITNLVSNAVKYTPPGGSITLRAEPAGNGMVRTLVRDTGIGIPPDQHFRIFQKFEQVHRPPGEQQSGTGLGLALCKQLIELNHGSIGFASEPERGSTFFFLLPASLSPNSAGTTGQEEGR